MINISSELKNNFNYFEAKQIVNYVNNLADNEKIKLDNLNSKQVTMKQINAWGVNERLALLRIIFLEESVDFRSVHSQLKYATILNHALQPFIRQDNKIIIKDKDWDILLSLIADNHTKAMYHPSNGTIVSIFINNGKLFEYLDKINYEKQFKLLYEIFDSYTHVKQLVKFLKENPSELKKIKSFDSKEGPQYNLNLFEYCLATAIKRNNRFRTDRMSPILNMAKIFKSIGFSLNTEKLVNFCLKRNLSYSKLEIISMEITDCFKYIDFEFQLLGKKHTLSAYEYVLFNFIEESLIALGQNNQACDYLSLNNIKITKENTHNLFNYIKNEYPNIFDKLSILVSNKLDKAKTPRSKSFWLEIMLELNRLMPDIKVKSKNKISNKI